MFVNRNMKKIILELLPHGMKKLARYWGFSVYI